MTGLQTFYPNILKKTTEKNFVEYLEKFTHNPRKILRMNIPVIKEEEKADLTLFDPDQKWTYSSKTNYSKSHNSPLLGKELKGKVVGVISNGKNFFNNF